GPLRLSKAYPHPQQQQQQSPQLPPLPPQQQQQQQTNQFYQPTNPNPQTIPMNYGGDFPIPQGQMPSHYGGDFPTPQGSMSSHYGGDYNVPQPQSMPSNNAFFSSQTAFYAPPSQQMSGNQAMPGMEYLSNNPLFNVGLNVVEQGMKDFTGKTVSMLPNE
ncbi:unnamed protein product, partial [Rotaria magnacalcarata]